MKLWDDQIKPLISVCFKLGVINTGFVVFTPQSTVGIATDESHIDLEKNPQRMKKWLSKLIFFLFIEHVMVVGGENDKGK